MSKELLQKIKSIKLLLMAHPDNEENSEFADRISDLEEIENVLSKKGWFGIFIFHTILINKNNKL